MGPADNPPSNVVNHKHNQVYQSAMSLNGSSSEIADLEPQTRSGQISGMTLEQRKR